MQFVNDDMDDELYRRAAEEYPLNTDNGDWNKVQDKLKSAGANSPKRKRRNITLLLALVPLLVICTTYITNDSMPGMVGLRDKKNTTEQNTSLETAAPGTEFKTMDDYPTSKDQSSASHKSNNELNEQQTITQNQNRITFSGTKQGNKDDQINNRRAVKQTQNTSAGIIDLKSEKSSQNKTNINAEEVTKNQETADQIDKELPVFPGATVSDNSVAVEKATEQEKKDSVNNIPATASPKEKKEKRKEPKFYLGLLAGPDFSMVKSTNSNGFGYSAGLIAGYNLSRRWAVETGLLWDQKKYYSEGKYFKTEKLNWPPHTNLLYLSGYCNMFEIPVNVRYNVIVNSKSTWFANAGISSYLMKKEDYDYRYERYGAYGYNSREYKNTSSNWLSVAHLSFGLQKKLGAIADLRIEPYVKLPLTGVGIGSMPLSSTGIYLGITRSIR